MVVIPVGCEQVMWVMVIMVWTKHNISAVTVSIPGVME